MRTRKILLLLLFITLTPITAQASSWVNFPASWDIGQAFAVSITSTADYSQPVVTWMNRTISLNVEQGGAGKISYGLLGSDVRNVKPGTYPILFEFVQGGKRYKASGNIRLRTHDYPKEELHVNPKMVNPPKKELNRIRSEQQLISTALRTMTPLRRWTTPHEPAIARN